MNSQLNNQNDNQDHVLQETETFRPVFFDLSAKRNLSSAASDSAKRVRLDASVIAPKDQAPPAAEPLPAPAPTDVMARRSLHIHRHLLLGDEFDRKTRKKRVPPTTPASRAPKCFRRFRLRLLPIINYTSRLVAPHHVLPPRMTATQFAAPVPALPPINLHLLKEIDLHEILKNPQLRHDILFDPQLQFRPNLDGERGRRKRAVIEKYWADVDAECRLLFAGGTKVTRLPVLFTTLRDILLLLLPVKDRAPVNEIMDIDLLVQQLSHGSFDFVAMAKWLGDVFKSHCAPMRDQWVSDMISKFQHAYLDNSVEKLVQGLRTIFSILEAMKLDVANHQIRILRPVLIETAVDFERDYFSQLISHSKIDITDSLKWFYRNYNKKAADDDLDAMRAVMVLSVIDLLSCRNMASEFPSTLAFDHTRLVLLRADVRQLVCVQLCVVLYKQLLATHPGAVSYRAAASKPEALTRVQEEILAIVTDDNGNVKWTRNVQAIALQLVKNVVTDPAAQAPAHVPQALVDFGYNWLIKQIQPSSDVYGLMELRVFKDLLGETLSTTTFDGAITMQTMSDTKQARRFKKMELEMSNIATRISTLVKFHWSVFGDYYADYLKKNKKH